MRWWAMACAFLLLAMTATTANAVNMGDSTRHFNVTYCDSRSNRMNNADFLSSLEESYDYVNGYFGSCPDHVEVIVIDDKDMDKFGKQVDSFFAWNQQMSAIILRQGTLKNRTLLPVIVSHEMTHLAVNDILCKKDPADFHWAEEGISMTISKEPLEDADVSKYIVSHGFLNTSEIFSAIKNENTSISKNGYMNSYSLVKYIEQRYGINTVINMLECPETSFDKAFKQYTGEDFQPFYAEWKKSVMTTALGAGK